MPYRIALDIGSKVIKAAIGDENLNIIAMQEVQPGVQCSEDGFCRACDHSTYWEQILSLVKQTISTSGIDPMKVDFLTCSSIRPSCVFTDDDYNPLYVGTSFDLRGIDGSDKLEEQFMDMTGKSIFEATGHFPALMFSPARYLWFKENEGTTCATISRYMPVDSWVLTKLGAEEHVNVASAAESGFFDIERKEWNYEWLDILDVNEFFLPPVIQSGEIVGDICQETQDKTGINPDAQLVSGLPDTQAALIGAGCIDNSSACAVVGSTTPVQVLKKDFFIDPGINTWTTCINLKDIVDSYIVEASCGISGQILRWAGALFYSDSGEFRKDHYSQLDADYDEFDKREMQSNQEGNDVVAFLGPNYLASAGTSVTPGVIVFPTPGMVDETTATKQQFIASIFENMQFATYKNLQYLRKLLNNALETTFILGGVTKSDTFTQRFADLNGSSIKTSREVESTTIGLLITCARAAGEITSPSDLKEKIQQAGIIVDKLPREKIKGILRSRFDVWDGYRKKIGDF